MNEEIRIEIEKLRHQTNKKLKSRYRELFDEEAKSSNHAHLFRSNIEQRSVPWMRRSIFDRY